MLELGNPVRVPPRRVTAHYRQEVERQIAAMLNQAAVPGWHQLFCTQEVRRTSDLCGLPGTE